MKENEPQIQPGGYVKIYDRDGKLVHQTMEAEYSLVTMAEETLGLEGGDEFIENLEQYMHTKFPDCLVCIK